ncbi:unnamed protein product [Tetraodon nigroviridis]|uniref:(spotted green pufferfish) hypothetical protein n=1 Tax=Tetraodon nigroviridis TaxID=99883 RepID=Q4RYJ3_TETNG|nr:unnamed protein product [Tetraodon nigroviridis]
MAESIVCPGHAPDRCQRLLPALARAGNLEKTLDYLKNGVDINICNQVRPFSPAGVQEPCGMLSSASAPQNGLNALHLASKEGHVEVVAELIKLGANVDAATKNEGLVRFCVLGFVYRRMLHAAVHGSPGEHLEVVQFLLDHGSSQSIATEVLALKRTAVAHLSVLESSTNSSTTNGASVRDGFTPLAVALQQGHDQVVSLLLENDTKGKVPLPALHIAARKDDTKAAALLLQSDHNANVESKMMVNRTTESGFTPLHIAAHYGNINVATLLLNRGASVDFKARNDITPLHVASKRGNTNMVRLLLERGAKIDARTKDGLTPLHCGARSGHEQVVDMLLNRGAPILSKTKNGLSPLHMATQGDHLNCVQLLLHHDVPVDDVTNDYLTALHVAAHCGHYKVAKVIVDKKANPNAKALSGLTPIHVAAFMGHDNIVHQLISHGASPNTSNVRGETALHMAARAGQSNVVRYLIQNGARVDARAKVVHDDQTPLHISSRLGKQDIVQQLLANGASPDATTSSGYTPLHLAAREGHRDKGFTPLHVAAKYGNMEVANLLLQKNACPDAAGKNGYTPLHIAAKKNQMEITTTLLEYGAPTNTVTRQGITPLHLAAQEGNIDVVTLLLARDAPVNVGNKSGLTPLHLAAQEDKVNVAEILVNHGATLDPETKLGYTPLHVACHYGNVKMVNFLLKNQAKVNAKTKNGYTPLHQASQQGHTHVINLLLHHGASPNELTNNGNSALSIARRLGYISVVDTLKAISEETLTTQTVIEKHKMNVPETMNEVLDMSDDDVCKANVPEMITEDYLSDMEEEGFTPLHVAAKYGNMEVANLLLQKNACPDAAGKNGYTPLHIAAKKNQMEITTTLLEYGAPTNTVTRQGITPLHLAAQEGNIDVVTLLLARDAPVNVGNKSGLTPLHLAAQEDKVNVAEILVNHGATLDPETKLGYTPLHVACHYGNVKMVNFLLKNQAKVNAKTKNGNSALSIARRLGYISVTVIEKHKMNVPETMNEVLDMSDDDGDDAMTGDTDKYLAPQDLRELGDDSLPQEGYMGFSVGARSQSLRSFSSDRSNTLNRSSFTRDSMMIEEILAPSKDTLLAVARNDNDSLRRYSWTPEALDNVNLVSSPVHSGFLVSFMVDARGGSMRGSRHNGMRIIIPPRKCTAPTRITCRLAKRHKLATPPPMVEGEGLASRLVEVGPAGAQFLGPVIVEIPHFGSMRGQERELIILRSENGESWKEHLYDCKTDNLVQLLAGMDEELDSPEELERKRICRIITKDFPQYFAVVSRIRQETNQMGPEGGTLRSRSVALVQASFPEGALTKKIKVGLQAQPVPEDTVKKILGNRATFSPIVTVEPRRRKFHKPITMTIPVPPLSGEGLTNGYKGDSTPCLRLLCSITGGCGQRRYEPTRKENSSSLTPTSVCQVGRPRLSGRTSPAPPPSPSSTTASPSPPMFQPGEAHATPSSLAPRASFRSSSSSPPCRFWLADCHQIPETVGLATQLYRELICVPYMAKFVVFAKMNDHVESRLRCFCMTDDKVDKTLEQQENFEEVARSKDIEVLEGRPIYVDCYGNLTPLTKTGQQLILNFYAFKENRLPFCVKVRDPSQEACGRLTFLKECKPTKGLPQTAVCNLNITLPSARKLSERSSSLQERIQATTQAATSTVSAALNEAIDSHSVSGYGTLKSLSSSRRSVTSGSAYDSVRTIPATMTSTMTVPVYSLVNVIPETPVKPGPGSLKMVLPDAPRALSSFSSPLSSCVTVSKIKSQVKSPPFITPPVIHPAAPSSQEILKDVADMKEDLIRMTAILQTDTPTAAKTVQTSNTGTPKEPKLEDEEPFTLVERVKEDLVKVSEILQKNIMNDSKDTVSEDEWEEFSRDEIEEAQMSVPSDYYPPQDESTVLFKRQSSKELDLAQVVDFLTNDIGASSLSKMAELKSRYEEETKREGEEKLKRVLKPSMSIQEHKLKMPPPVSGMTRSPSEKDLSRLAESYQGTDVILESPEDLSHEQDKSPLSDSGFETRSEKTPSAPQSAESTGPKPLFTESPIPPCVTETRTEVVHIRSFEPSDEACEPSPVMEAASATASTEPDALQTGAATALHMKLSEEDSMINKSLCLKEETHITTTTRMVYHKPSLTDGTEMVEEGMSVRDLMKAFQSGRDPSKELAGLFEHKSNQDSVKGDELTPRFLDRDVKSKPKVERIIEVHIEKGHSTAEPTEVIIRETKKHPELYVYKGDHGIKELTGFDELQQEEEELAAEEYLPSFLESRVNTPVSQEEDSRPSSAQLIADDSYKALKLLSQHSIEYCDDELSEIRGETYNFAEKVLLSEKLDTPLSYSDLDDSASAADKKHHLDSGQSGAEFQQQGSPKKEFVSKLSKDGSPKSGKFLQRDEPSQFDKVTVLHYSTEQGSPKHAVWMRFTEDKQDRSRDKLLYEDRVDQTVKEAEEKLCEVSQFFRDKTEKLNDELQSPEKKPLRRELKEPRSWPSSVRSSPERTMQKPKMGDESTGKSMLREPSVSKISGGTGTPEKKSVSVPSSPQKGMFVHASKETIQKESKTSESEYSASKVSAARMKFESAAQKQSASSPVKTPPPVQPKPSIKKLQESKLPVYQYSSAGKVSKVSETAEKISPIKDTCPLTDGSKSTAKVGKFTQDKFSNKNVPPESPQSRNQVTETCKVPRKDSNNHFNQNTTLLQEKDGEKNNWVTKRETASREPVTQGPQKDTELTNTNLRKKAESQIPVKSSSTLVTELAKKQSVTKVQIPTTAKSKTQKSVETPVNTDKTLTFEILDNAPRDSNFNNLPSPREALEKVLTPPTTVTKENFRGIKTLPVYVSVQVGRQAEREAKGSLYAVKQTTNSTVSPISPDDDTMEQVSFIDSSGKSPVTPETPSSEEVSYDLTSKTPDGFMGFVPGKPSPIMEVCEESEEDEGKDVLSFRERQTEAVVPSTQADLANANREELKTIDNKPNINQVEKTADSRNHETIGQVHREASRDKGIAYIEFPPPPPLDSSETSDAERKGSCASSETETEMMEVNLQEEHDKHLLTEPIIRIQPPTPVLPSADDSQSNDDESDRGDDESIFQPIPSKKFTSKAPEEEEEEEEGEKKGEKGKTSKCKKHDKNGNDKEPLDGTNGYKGSNGQGEDYECEQNGNDQSITDCSIATTAEFSHDTDATEIDSLDGYELQDEDDGLCEEADLQLFGLPNSRRDVWATDTFRSSDHSFPPTKLEVIEEEKSPEECQIELLKNDFSSKGEKDDGVSPGEVKCQDQKPSGKEGFSDAYFSYKLGEDFNSPFKTVATKGLDFDPWPSKGGEEVVHVGGPQGGEGEPKPFGLAVDDQSQATTPDTTPARTPTDDSTPTSEPNPFPFHEGKMFEMTRSGAIDMSKRDMVEERLQFFQIGPQSPCERTNLRMAIVADHLGLSWTELARELDFSVEEINFIRVENPNSLTAQSFMLLKKWVHRDGKNATTDALTAVLTKINRLDIVTLLEGPIFDYGNISGTRCFADDNAVFPDQSDGYQSIDLELKTPSDLSYEPPTPLRSDHFFSEGDPSADTLSQTALARPSDLSITQTSSKDLLAPGAPITEAEDTALSGEEREDAARLEPHQRPENDRRVAEKSRKGTEEKGEETERGEVLEAPGEDRTSDRRHGNGLQEEEEEEEEEMSQERLRSLLEDIKLEGGLDDVEMTEEGVRAILEQVRQAEKDVCSLPGWRGQAAGSVALATGPGQTPAEEGSPDRLADALETSTGVEGHAEEARKEAPQEGGGAAGPSTRPEGGGERARPRAQVSRDRWLREGGARPAAHPRCLRQEKPRVEPSSSEEEEPSVTTRVFRRRLVVKGEEARNLPRESVTEDQFIDEDGNLVTRKVTALHPSARLHLPPAGSPHPSSPASAPYR